MRTRVAVVTGGGSGIGRAMAQALAEHDVAVVVIGRTPATLDATVALIQRHDPKRVQTGAAVVADLSDRAALHRAADEAAAIFGEPDMLVNCAGLNLRPPLDDLTEVDWDQTLAINLTAPFLLGQRYGPGMAARGFGRIVNIGSQQTVRAFGNSGVYGVAKAGVAALSRSQAEAWSSRGVCCNTIVPGFVLTPMTEGDPAKAEAMAARTMMGRNGRPEDYRGVIAFLASDESAFVTGQTLFVDGGFSAR